jgi:hypothetical protein
MSRLRSAALLGAALLLASPAGAAPFLFSTGTTDGKMASASRPESTGKFEIESADDFIAPSPVDLSAATFTGLLTGGASVSDIGQVRIEIYRVFPNDSTNPPSGHVPTRMNSPSDVAFAERDSTTGDLLSVATVLSSSFTAANSVQPGGIHPIPGFHTGGDGMVTGTEVQFTVAFNSLSLPADHYFFVPQVEVNGGEFLWLSAPKPITQGTPFNPDLQSWTRDAALDPDWLRIGMDIVGGDPAPAFNASFSLLGQVVPEPSTAVLVLLGVALVAWSRPRS